MAPTIHLVRHAQGFHNLSLENQKIADPNLTPLGSSQCASLRSIFPHHDRLTTLVASSMRRTLYTCIESFGTDKLYPVVALDTLQEVSDSACDTGSSVDKLAAEFGNKVDLSRVREDWNVKGEGSLFEPDLKKLAVRAREARRALREIAGQGDEHIAVVSHGAFLHFLTEDWHGITNEDATSWKNCEYRSFQFVDPTGEDEDAAIRETEESWRRRHGDLRLPTSEEQRELRDMMERELAPLFKVKA